MLSGENAFFGYRIISVWATNCILILLHCSAVLWYGETTRRNGLRMGNESTAKSLSMQLKYGSNQRPPLTKKLFYMDFDGFANIVSTHLYTVRDFTVVCGLELTELKTKIFGNTTKAIILYIVASIDCLFVLNVLIRRFVPLGIGTINLRVSIFPPTCLDTHNILIVRAEPEKCNTLYSDPVT